MQGLDMYYNNLQAQHQRRLDEQAELEANMDKFKELISKLLEENHPNELATPDRGRRCDLPKKVVHQLYMEGFNDPDCWEPERSGDIWVIYGKNFSGEWIDENGNYLGFDTKREAMEYIKETFK
jgi:hypothetical protein